MDRFSPNLFCQISNQKTKKKKTRSRNCLGNSTKTSLRGKTDGSSSLKQSHEKSTKSQLVQSTALSAASALSTRSSTSKNRVTANTRP